MYYQVLEMFCVLKKLGYQDLNLERRCQKPLCYLLHHSPARTILIYLIQSNLTSYQTYFFGIQYAKNFIV